MIDGEDEKTKDLRKDKWRHLERKKIKQTKDWGEDTFWGWKKWLNDIPGHPAELSDSVKLLLTGAKSHVFEIDPVLKSIYWHFLCQNFVHFGQVVCLQHEFEVKAFISGLSRFSNKFQELCKLTSQFFLNHIRHQYKKGFNQGKFWSSLIT